MATGGVAFVPMNQGFDERDPKYKCCCSKCHVKTGVVVLAILLIVSAATSVISAVWSMLGPDPEPDTDYDLPAYQLETGPTQKTTYNGVDARSIALGRNLFMIFYCGLEIVVGVMALIGVRKENKQLLLPLLIFVGISVVVVAISGVCLVVLMVFWGASIMVLLGSSSAASDEDSGFMVGGLMVVMVIIILIVFILIMALLVWFFLIILNCWRYFKAKQLHGNGQNVAFNQPAQPNTYYPSDAYPKQPAFNPSHKF